MLEPNDNTVQYLAGACSCVKTFDVLATTGNRRYGQSVGPHNIEVTLRTNEVRSLPLTDMLWLGRTHLWKFHIADFGFTTIRCVSPFDIKKIALVARSTDGWFIESIVTFIADNDGNTLVSSINERLNRWVKHPIDPGFSLNLLFRRAY